MLVRARSPLPWLAGLLALYLLAPIVAFVVRLRHGIGAAPEVGSALATSLATATVATIVIALFGTPLAYLLARGRGYASRALTALVALPLALPPLMSGLLLLYVLGPRTTLGRLFDGQLTETRLAIVLAQTFVAAPFLVIAARAAFAAVDPALEEVAATLGHGRLARFWRVAVPAALPGIGAGLLLAWLRSFGEFGATVILAYHPYSLPVYTFVEFDATGLPATMLPIAVALGAALAVLLLSGARAPRRRRHSRPPGPVQPTSTTTGADDTLDFSLSKRLGAFSLRIAHRGGAPHLALLGPSGAGKTLTLRLLAGLTRPDNDARVSLGSRELEALEPEQRRLGYVPQQPALLPRRTVWRQVTFGVAADPALAAWWIERLGLAGLEDRLPDELSGGQQRRVALARALAVQPRVLLLDEPFAGLDAPVRDRLRRELRSLQRETTLSTVLVTHDPEEAALLADEVLVLDEGHVLQAGTRSSVFGTPRSPQVAALLGIANTHHGVVLDAERIESQGVELLVRAHGFAPGTDVTWSIRPEHVELREDGRYAARLLDDADLGSMRELTVELGGELVLTVRTLDGRALATGDALRVALPPERISVWRREAQPPM
ncbi:MAG TPA: ATP-binding cassette domain-containing protein [Solirubrobacteraceae bacterium]|nr:ATP-binding cassette domain-containing protein [Solirubrobacteraceae bacterium]